MAAKMEHEAQTSEARFAEYVGSIAGVLGRDDRARPLADYCTGLLMPGERKSVEPMAAVVAPARVSAKHQSLLHLVGQVASPCFPQPPRLGGLTTSPFWHARLQFQATKRGAQAVRDDRKGFARIMWETWSPQGWFDDATFDRVAASFDNHDWADVTLHSYRSRWDEAEPDPASKWLDDKVKATKTLALPTIYFQGELDGVNPPKASERVA
jgi:hypothetical protein